MHNDRLQSLGYGYISYDLVPLPFETSGAWGREMKDLWKELKGSFPKGNFLSGELQRPCTFTAFTPKQYFPQLVSFIIAHHTAKMVLAGMRMSRRGYVFDA